MLNNYHMHVRAISKSKGRSAVQLGAYIAGEKAYNERTGESYNHTSKEEVSYRNMLFSQYVPAEIQDFEKFWNFVEKKESRENAQFAREIEVSLPREGMQKKDYNIVADQMAKHLLGLGYSAVQYAVHNKEGNPHIHYLVYDRGFDKTGELQIKREKGYLCRDDEGREIIARTAKDIPESYKRVPILNKDGTQKTDSRNRLQWKRVELTGELKTREHVRELRRIWERIENSHLSPELQVDSRSYMERGLSRLPTQHVGPAEMARVRRNEPSEVFEHNLRILRINQLLESVVFEIEKRIKKLQEILTNYLFERNHKYENINIRRSYEDYIFAEISNRRAQLREPSTNRITERFQPKSRDNREGYDERYRNR